MNLNLIIAELSLLRVGIAGVVPIPVIVKVFGDRVERLKVFGVFLGG